MFKYFPSAEDPVRLAHARLNVDRADVLPSLLQQRDQIVDGDVDVLSELLRVKLESSTIDCYANSIEKIFASNPLIDIFIPSYNFIFSVKTSRAFFESHVIRAAFWRAPYKFNAPQSRYLSV